MIKSDSEANKFVKLILKLFLPVPEKYVFFVAFSASGKPLIGTSQSS
jgi:hypothetical protein